MQNVISYLTIYLIPKNIHIDIEKITKSTKMVMDINALFCAA